MLCFALIFSERLASTDNAEYNELSKHSGLSNVDSTISSDVLQMIQD